MKLLMVTGLGSARDLASGRRGAFYNTLEEFHKHWDRIDIICPRIKNYESRITNLFGNVYVHVSPWPLLFHPFWFLKTAVRIYKKEKFDLMTVQDYPPFYNGIGARLLWQKIRVPYILEVFHIPGYPQAANKKEFIYRSLAKVFFGADASRAKAVRIMNSGVGDFLIESGVPANKLLLIPAVYVDLDIFKPMNLQKEYDLIFIGRLESNKGIDLLLKAIEFSIFNLKFPIKCLIVGEGSLKENLKFKIENNRAKPSSGLYGHLKLQDNVLFHGFAKDQKEIAELINKSKILVMPSYNEGGPRVVVEAMACGVPVLATPVGIVPDLLKNGLGGEIIDWDAKDIAQKIAGLLGDPEAYKKHSLAGLQIAQKFEKKVAIKNYADKIKSV